MPLATKVLRQHHEDVALAAATGLRDDDAAVLVRAPWSWRRVLERIGTVEIFAVIVGREAEAAHPAV
jgi:hypothetical protein